MKNKQTRREFQAHWERAVEEAAESKGQNADHAPNLLTDAAGVHVQSGVRSGWGTSGACGSNSCPWTACFCGD